MKNKPKLTWKQYEFEYEAWEKTKKTISPDALARMKKIVDEVNRRRATLRPMRRAMKKPLLLGLKVSSGGSTALGLDGSGGSAGRRLWRLSGMSRQQYLATFDRANVADCPSLADRRVAVLGREAWRLLGLPRADFFETRGRFTLLPHTSGRNRLFNDPRTRARARRILRRMADAKE
jgi:hypothetical protein